MNARSRRLFPMYSLKEEAKKERQRKIAVASLCIYTSSVLYGILHGLLSLSVDREHHSIISLRIFST